MATKRKKKNDSKNISYKDVCLRYLVDGVSVLESLAKAGDLSAAMARKALLHLSVMAPMQAGPFEGWIHDRYPIKTRGRAEPNPGEERTYKAQKVSNGGPFLRLPLSPLGVKKGDKIKVRFEKDRLVASAA